MLVSLTEILADTRKNKYAVGLFNCVNIEMCMGILRAAEELNSPVIIGPGESLLPSAGLEEYTDFMLAQAKRAKVPVTLHFDHGFDPNLVRKAVDLGYSSVMYDCSLLPFEENSKRVKEMVSYAHQAGCSLEAEIGHVGSNGSAEEKIADTIYTNPEDAALFAEQSHCDALAVAIGTAHGLYIKKPELNINSLSKIAATTNIPLVLHGGSGLSDDDFRSCIANGISKINIFTDNNLAAARAAKEHFTDKRGAFELMPYITEAVKQVTMQRIMVFGSNGRA